AGELPSDPDTNDRTLAPYSSYPTADGHMNVALANQGLWTDFCDAIDNQELKNDERFESNATRVEHRDELKEELSEIFQERTTEEWLDLLVDEHDLPFSKIHNIEEALHNEQAEARGALSSTTHPTAGDIPVIEHPLNYEHADVGFQDSSPPLLGEDTVDVFKEIGYEDEEIDQLKESGAIPDRD
ncbi:MAG TPA: CoA transferase, partial [Methanomicrobiales archaeon]|nr:CoA transferase [Methanomicrobiales archaeon]